MQIPQHLLDLQAQFSIMVTQDMFINNQKGFVNFQRNQRQYYPKTYRLKTSDMRFRTIEKFKTQPEFVNQILKINQSKLSTLNKTITSQRQNSYRQFINKSVQYQRLLQLNLQKSKMFTSIKRNVGEIKVKALQQVRPQNYYYQVQYRIQQIKTWKPQPRQGQVCIIYKDNLLLFGGHNSNPINQICTYSFKQKKWSQLFTSNLSRTYHSGVVYKQNYIIIFGGMSNFNPYFKSRQCLNTSYLFNISSNTLKHIKVADEQMIQPRRNHSANILGKYMYIFGGINTQKKYLRDLKYLNIKQLKWYNRQYKCSTQSLQKFLFNGLAKHSAVDHFQQRTEYPLYSSAYQIYQGFYIFGGINQTGEQNNILKLSFRKRIALLQKIIPAGVPPTSSLNSKSKKLNQNIIIIISGQNQFREIKLYKIRQNMYVDVINNESLPCLGGLGSSFLKYNNEFYLFFGLGQQGYLSTIYKLNIIQKQRKKQINKKRRETMLNYRRKLQRFDQSDQSIE